MNKQKAFNKKDVIDFLEKGFNFYEIDREQKKYILTNNFQKEYILIDSDKEIIDFDFNEKLTIFIPITIKKCPFCGHDPIFNYNSELVHCKNINCAIGDFYIHYTEWNKRFNQK